MNAARNIAVKGIDKIIKEQYEIQFPKKETIQKKTILKNGPSRSIFLCKKLTI